MSALPDQYDACVVTMETRFASQLYGHDLPTAASPFSSWRTVASRVLAIAARVIDTRMHDLELSDSLWPTRKDAHQIQEEAIRLRTLLQAAGLAESTVGKVSPRWRVVRGKLEIVGPKDIASRIEFFCGDEWTTMPNDGRTTVRLRLPEEETGNGLPLHTPDSIKGLEFGAVVLFVPESCSRLPDAETYVAVSRARLYLAFVVPHYANFGVLQGLPPDAVRID